MKTRYLNPTETLIELTLEPGETFRAFICADEAANPFVVPILTQPANDDGDALLALIADGHAPVPDPLSPTASPPVAPSTFSVSKAQGKLALRAAGLLDQVKQMVADSDDEELQIWWEDASSWDRSSKYIAAFAQKLGLSDQQVTDLFTAASQIKT